jgi:DNA-directed RNA polymerase beta subunit
MVAAAASSVKTEFMGDDLPEAAVKGNSKELSAEEEEEARWTVAKIFFQNRSLVEHQLRSFNEFLEDGLQAMVNDAPPFEVSPDHNPAAIRIEGLPRQARISFGNVSVGKSTCSATEDKKDVVDLYPREARLRNLTYSAPINLDMNLKVCRSIDITLWWRHMLWQHSLFWISFPLTLYWLKLCKVFFASLSDIIII